LLVVGLNRLGVEDMHHLMRLLGVAENVKFKQDILGNELDFQSKSLNHGCHAGVDDVALAAL
jgi:hypothetical protein